MQKKIVVVDTNVLVSAALGNGYCSKIMFLFEQENVFEISYSDEVIFEYKRVSTYTRILRKYPLFEIKVNEIIIKLLRGGRKYIVTQHLANLRDTSDNKFLDLAYACEADYLITGNHLDFTITEFYKTKIVSPKIFWELYQDNSL